MVNYYAISEKEEPGEKSKARSENGQIKVNSNLLFSS